MKISRENLVAQIRKLKHDKNITLLAHYYQRPEIQELADFVGDSLALSKRARECDSDIILFAGVHFMGQTAKIINPGRKVLLPDLEAGCSLADACPPDLFKDFIQKYSDHVVVTYINCSAEIKAMSDIVCTSSNAEKIIQSIPVHQPIIFAPDKNLGRYLIKRTGRELVLWDGSCVVHEAFSIDKLLALHREFPEAMIVAHPESEPHILRVAHYVGSTSGMVEYVRRSKKTDFIVATEAGVLHAMADIVHGKNLIPAPTNENNSCACSECAYMKLNTLEKVYSCMLNEYPVIEVEESLRLRALEPLLRMLKISEN